MEVIIIKKKAIDFVISFVALVTSMAVETIVEGGLRKAAKLDDEKK